MNRKNARLLCLYGLIGPFLSGSMLISTQVSAANWICSGTQDWSNANCWDTNEVPKVGDSASAFIDSNNDVVINYNGLVNSGDVLSDVFLNNSGTGSVILNRADALSLNTDLMVVGTDGNAVVNHSAGSSAFNYMIVADTADSVATYNISGTASINTTYGVWLGTSGTGIINQSGGNLTSDEFTMGDVAGGYGEYNLSGGQLNVTTGYVGYFGDANFSQTGGVLNAVDLHVGRKTGTGVYTLDAGALNVSNALEIGTIPARATSPAIQDAVFIQNGGTLTVTNGFVRTSASGMANASYDLNGGTLTASLVTNNDTFEYSGGTLNANVKNSDRFIFNGAGTRTINGDFTNIGQTYFFHTFSPGGADELTIDRFANGLIELKDGTLVDITGDLSLESLGTLAIDLNSGYLSITDQPWVSVAGTSSLAGTLDLADLLDDASLVDNYYTWTLLESSLVDGSFDEVLFPVLASWDWDILYGVDNVTLVASISSVPVPGAVWLFASGLIGLVGVSRRKNRKL